MDKFIKQILDKINEAGFEGYLVGGYVRDKLLGINSKDIDICTNALPKDIHNLFNSGKSNYGSVNIKTDKFNIDITTFRKDMNYVNRRPSEVIYIDSLKEDLTRRDFTINAICMDKDDKIIDLINGVEDINKRVIKMIGDPFVRLKEDPLRILRAIRFATILDFNLDPNLLEAIKENYRLVGTLSKMRIKEELDKILMSKNFKKGLDLLHETKISEVIKLKYESINYVEDLIGMYAQISIDEMPFTNEEKSNIIKITEILNLGIITNEVLFKYDLYICNIACRIMNIDPKKIAKMYKSMPIKTKDDIDITSDEIKAIVGDGKVIGETYQLLIKEILNKKLRNKKVDIIKYLNKRK